MNAHKQVRNHDSGAATAPLFVLKPVDAEALKAIDPLAPTKPFALWAALTEPADITVAGSTIATLEPVEAGQRTADLGPSLDLYEAIVAALGTEEDGKVDDRWIAEGSAAMHRVLAHVPKATLALWRRENEVVRRQAENVGRAYGMPADAIEAIVQRPFIARAGLLQSGSKAKDLAELAKDAKKREERALREFEEAERERLRPRTTGELEIECIAIRNDRLGGAHPPYAAPGGVPYPLWSTSEETVYGYKHVLGLELPVIAQDGVRVLGRDEIVPPGAIPATEPTSHAVGFAIDVRNRFCKTLDFGPIAHFTDAGHARAIEIVVAFRDWLIHSDFMHGWKVGHVCQLVTRGCLVRPDYAASLLIAARDGVLAELYSVQSVPIDPSRDIALASERAKLGPAEQKHGRLLTGQEVISQLEDHEWSRKRTIDLAHPLARGPSELASDPIAVLCVNASAGGHVGAGELLEGTTFQTTK